MSGRHVAHEAASSTQHMGELCASGGLGRRGPCSVHDLGGNGRHRWSPVVDSTPVPRHTVQWPPPDALAAMTRSSSQAGLASFRSTR